MLENCPYCHKNLNETWVTPYCSKDNELYGTQYPLNDDLRRSLSKGRLKCKKCASAIKNIKCANKECGKTLPAFVWDRNSTNIAIIGAKGSGKSHFIAVLLNQLRRETGAQFGIEVVFESQEQRDYYNRNYWKPLYKDNQLLLILIQHLLKTLSAHSDQK